MQNLLPYDGVVYYQPKFLNKTQSDYFFQTIRRETQWDNDVVKMFGKTHVLRRKSAWYGDPLAFYRYGGIDRTPMPWTQGLKLIKTLLQNTIQERFNSALLNYYHDGQDAMSWHRDNEKELVPRAAIASLSLGASRKFVLKHLRSKEKREFILDSGSLLVMKGEIQEYWAHALPKTKRVHTARINLTFRQVVADQKSYKKLTAQ